MTRDSEGDSPHKNVQFSSYKNFRTDKKNPGQKIHRTSQKIWKRFKSVRNYPSWRYCLGFFRLIFQEKIRWSEHKYHKWGYMDIRSKGGLLQDPLRVQWYQTLSVTNLFTCWPYICQTILNTWPDMEWKELPNNKNWKSILNTPQSNQMRL